MVTKLLKHARLWGIVGIGLGVTGIFMNQIDDTTPWLLFVLLGVAWFGMSSGIIYSCSIIQKERRRQPQHTEEE